MILAATLSGLVDLSCGWSTLTTVISSIMTGWLLIVQVAPHGGLSSNQVVQVPLIFVRCRRIGVISTWVRNRWGNQSMCPCDIGEGNRR